LPPVPEPITIPPNDSQEAVTKQESEQSSTDSQPAEENPTADEIPDEIYCELKEKTPSSTEDSSEKQIVE
jgi:hypothetical protein